jgi:hypothetical protein
MDPRIAPGVAFHSIAAISIRREQPPNRFDLQQVEDSGLDPDKSPALLPEAIPRDRKAYLGRRLLVRHPWYTDRLHEAV